MRVHNILITAIFMVMTSMVSAQSRMTFLDWDILVQDTVCPVYSEVVPLESDYRRNDYVVRLEYPTWEPVNAKERVLAERYSKEICDSLVIEQYISVSRGEGLLNYSFIPFIKRNGIYNKLVSAQITIIPVPGEASARFVGSDVSKRYADKSVLATGTWKKIHITEDGIYRLTPKFLTEMGFKDVNKVHLYGYGGHQQNEVIDADNDYDDLEEVPLYQTSDGSLLFWGNGLVRWDGVNRVFNAYATKATYFLTENDATRRNIETEEQYDGVVMQNVSTSLGHALYEHDDYAWYRVGRNLVHSDLYSGATSRNYTLSGINSIGNEKLTVVFTANEIATPLTVSVNNAKVTSRTLPAPGSYMHFTEAKISNEDVMEYKNGNTWKITLSTQIEGTVTSDRVQGRLDYIAMNYTQPLELQKGFVRFGGGYSGTGIGTGSSPLVTNKFSGATRFTNISNNTNGVQVMRLGSRGNPAKLMIADREDNGLAFSVADGEDEFVAFDPTYSFPEPTAGGTVENQNLHAMSNVDMVIIVPSNGKLTAQAQRLADAHGQYDNLKCAVVRADIIYNEFSSGTPDATAYRRFLKMLYDRGLEDNTSPRYLLLMGNCAWDNRMLSQEWKKYSSDDYLLCYQSENSYSETNSYCWEDYFGLMDDGEGSTPTKNVSDIGIGRFPVSTEGEARIVVDKCIAHIQRKDAGEWCNKVVFLGDDGDDNIHMRDANRVANNVADKVPNMNIKKIMWDNYIRVNQGVHFTYPEVESIMASQMQEGALVINYTGHGAPYLLSHERVIDLDDMRSWKSTRLPLWFTAACDVMPFDSQEDNLGETALLNDGGVAVAFVGTSRTVYSTQNYYLNNLFFEHFFARDSDGRGYSVGDALRLAKSNMVSNGYDGGQAQNKLQYALLGDPALLFGHPEARVVLDSINGEAINGIQSMKGGSKVRLSGHIENADGSENEGFNGVVYYRLYDNKTSVSTRGNSGNKPFSYTDWNKEINNGSDNVVNGKFSTTVVIPRDINYSDENGRLVFYAVNEDASIEANGSSERFRVGGYSNEMENDIDGPDMVIYLNDEGFRDGDVVGNKPVFVAELYDESGIQFNGNGIGHDLQLCIDGRSDMTYNLNAHYVQEKGDYSSGKILYTDIPELEKGAHWLTFRAWDMLNNTTVKSLRFTVGEDLNPEVLSLVLEQDIISGQTNFHVAYSFPGLKCDFTLEILSTNGAVQWKQELSSYSDTGILTIPWQGSNGSGASLNSGIYICRVTVAHGNGKRSHKEKKFIFKSNK